ncbi:MG2 domain-containing protein [Flavisolibacter tropicus]|uniref:Macroglobulin domain-containing protein n=1 Tax=Flavisolibacter tropicus TaxID=1492898 RepID=A0A172TQ94_9BACT|nr:MG2 domain-containing protein [Flavisolibacter tropicus]ANE49146.1 hypothetical protein SY85_00145 [Flavisolibacter tropicus]
MRYPLTICLLILTALVSKAQTQTLAPDSALNTFKEQYPQEKVFVQTDKDVYISGETIWMKAWCALDGVPSFLSKILYVDLVDANGQVALKKMYQLDKLSSTGADFDVPESILTGTYSINAYTLWMLNFPEYIFRKNVFIYGQDYATKTSAKKPGKPSVSLHFFPEGGDLIAGVSNRIAFKATDKNGFPYNTKGFITDKNGKKVVELLTEHDGMGTAEFSAEEGNEYTANIPSPTDPKNNITYPLPKAKGEGIALRVENTNPNRLFVLLNRAEKGKYKFNNIKVIATFNHSVVFSKELDLDKGETAFTINKKNLPPGILHITLFDKNNLPISERITFIENYSFIQPSITIDHKDLTTKAKNQISFSIDSVEYSSFSCQITSYMPGDSMARFSENIASAFLVTSDLKGYIHNPGFYFKDKSAATLHALDLLLMTQGWRRFEWNKIQHKEFAALKYPVESAISFKGTVYKSDSKEKVTDGKVSFIIKGVDSTSILAEATVTDKGEFLLNDINYAKRAVVAYMGTNNKKEKYIVDVKLSPNYIDSLNSSLYTPTINLDTFKTNQQTALANYLNNQLNAFGESIRSKTLETVVVKAKRITPTDSLNAAYAGGPFLMGKGINPSDFKNYRTIWQMIQAAVPGVNVEGNPFDPTVTFSRYSGLGGTASSQNLGESSDGEISQTVLMETGGVAYFLNEVNVSKDVINTLTVDDIALIKVLKAEATALGASQGAIAIYTKQDVGASGAIYDKKYTKQKLLGYSISKEFYQPEYTFNPSLQETDNRFTLYWNANLIPAKDGKYRFLFYNNSTGTKAKLVIQGMDKSGQLIYKEQIIQ